MNQLQATSQILLERHLERRALRACESSSLEQCVRTYNIAPKIQVVSPRGKQVLLQARDASNTSTIEKFLRSSGRKSGVMLNTEGLELIVGYVDWLLHDYTDRYRWIATKDQRLWLEQVVTLVIVRHVMKQKYLRYLLADQQAFADPGTVASLDRIYWEHHLYSEMARCINHMAPAADRRALLEEFYAVQETHRKNRSPLVWEPLPPLPGELPHPYLLLVNEWEERDE